MSYPDARSNGPAKALHQALDGSEPLSRLLLRVQASCDCLAAVVPALPPELRGAVQAGPLDDSGWTLLAANAAVAAKLRHLLPVLKDALVAQSLAVAALRVKIHTSK